MKSLVKSLSFVAFAALILTSCGKYEDGPGISLRTKKARLAQEWQLDEVEIEGTDFTSSFNRWELEFEKEGDYSESLDIINVGSGTLAGEWEFSNDKEEVEITYDDGTKLDLDIKKLSKKELWFEVSFDLGDGTNEVWDCKFEAK